MHSRDDLPHRIRRFETFIPAADGTRLAARIWLPDDAERSPVPAVLEYIPYRFRDWTAERDAPRMTYYAGHGYAAVRVDMRGSGDSEGVLTDEYLPLEQEDGCDVIAWLAAQPWCTGAVGMVGKSWGGFNALQIAARRPPALKAIVTVCSTDDRYADDVHYMGGCVLASDMLGWAATMLAFNARPPDPRTHGERWRSLWRERFEGSPPFVEEWLRHQRRDAYWQQGSVCEDFAAIECAVLAVGGWSDPYHDAVLRLLAGLSCPRRGVIGPWAHLYPQHAVPGPAVGFLQEKVRFFDHWLKGEEKGAMDGPALVAYLQEPVAPATFHAVRPGRFVAEPAWPSPTIVDTTIIDREVERSIVGDQTHGVDAGVWCGYGGAEDQPPDQRHDDARSLCLDVAVAEPFAILGAPLVEVELSVDRPVALLAARLCDVAADGASLLVTRGVLNLTHRDSHEHPEPVPVGERLRVRLPLVTIGHEFQLGRTLRLALSPTYWPTAWPAPEPVTLTVHRVRLLLPVREPRAEDATIAFAEPEQGTPASVHGRGGAPASRRVTRDAASGVTTITYEPDWGGIRVLPDEDGLEIAERARDVFTIRDGDPLSARATSTWTIELRRGDWSIRIETDSEMTADHDAFHVVNEVRASESGRIVHEQRSQRSFRRDLV